MKNKFNTLSFFLNFNCFWRAPAEVEGAREPFLAKQAGALMQDPKSKCVYKPYQCRGWGGGGEREGNHSGTLGSPGLQQLRIKDSCGIRDQIQTSASLQECILTPILLPSPTVFLRKKNELFKARCKHNKCFLILFTFYFLYYY